MRMIILILTGLILAPVPAAKAADDAMPAANPAVDAPTADTPHSLKIATRLVDPFVIKEGDKLTGFSIDLWEEIAKRLGVTSEYDIRTTLPDLLGAVHDGGDTVAVAAISITAQREQDYDFSQPIFDAGLAILTPTGSGETSWLDMLLIWSKQILPALGVGLLLIFIPANIVWAVERKGATDIPIARAYIPGVLGAAYWVATLMGGQAEGMPKRPISRIIALVWIYVGLIFVAYFTAFATTSLTVQQLKSGINGPADLVGKRVASVSDSTAARYLREMGITPMLFPDIGQAIAALGKHEAQAVVYDSPILQHYASSTAGHGMVQIAGPTFRQEKYGILFPRNSALRKPVNEALLGLREDGVYQTLQRKWFGSEE